MKASEFVDVMMGEVPDSPPLFFFDFSMGIKAAGYRTEELFIPHYDGVRIARSLLATRKELGHDSSIGCPFVLDQRTIGGEVRYNGCAPPMVTKCAFADADKLYRTDVNEMTSICPEQRRSFEYIREKDPEFCIGVSSPSPMSLGCQLRGYEAFVMESITEPDYIDDLTRFSKEYIDIVQRNINDEGLAHYSMITSAFDIPEVFGPDYYRERIVPTYKDSVELARSYGLPTLIHPHGCLTDEDGSDNLDRIIGTGVDSIYFGENNDVHRLAEHCRGKVSLIGGVDSFTTIFLGDEERIRKDVGSFVDAFKDMPYIMSCSCSVESFLPMEKMRIMVDCTRSCRLSDRIGE